MGIFCLEDSRSTVKNIAGTNVIVGNFAKLWYKSILHSKTDYSQFKRFSVPRFYRIVFVRMYFMKKKLKCGMIEDIRDYYLSTQQPS